MSIKIFGFVICVLLALTVLKSFNGGISKTAAVVACLMLATFAVSLLQPAVDFINTLSSRVGFDNKYLEIIMKCTALCFLGSFTTNLCRDSGESTLAFTTEFACRCSIVVLTVPIYIDVLGWIIKLWENI